MSTPRHPSSSLPRRLEKGKGEGSQSTLVSAATREITFAQAINEALAEEMRRDPTVFIIGEDVAEAGTPFKVLSGLAKEFGTKRVIDSPISEAGIAGIGVGAAMTGMIFVTHSIDEAIVLGDRIVVMSCRPGRIREIFSVDISRPRKILTVRSHPRYIELRNAIWEMLKSEQEQNLAGEIADEPAC